LATSFATPSDDKTMTERDLEIPSFDGNFLSNAFYSGPKASLWFDNRETLGHIKLDLYPDLKYLHDPKDLKFFSFVSPSLIRIMCRIGVVA
jgi:hypothetical protein